MHLFNLLRSEDLWKIGSVSCKKETARLSTVHKMQRKLNQWNLNLLREVCSQDKRA